MKNLGRINDPLDSVTKDYVDRHIRLMTFFLSDSWEGSGPYTQSVPVSDAIPASVIQPVFNASLRGKMEADGITDIWIQSGNGTATVYADGAIPSGNWSMTVIYFNAADYRVDIEPDSSGGSEINITNGTATYTPNAAGGNTVDIGA